MRTRTKAGLAAGGALAALAVGGGVAVAQGGDEVEFGSHDLTADERAGAEKAALEATGGGTVNEVERDSEEGATYEVEVRRTDGSVVDVRLDENYELVVIEGDSDGSGDDGAE